MANLLKKLENDGLAEHEKDEKKANEVKILKVYTLTNNNNQKIFEIHGVSPPKVLIDELMVWRRDEHIKH